MTIRQARERWLRAELARYGLTLTRRYHTRRI
jgi:hypothetical protein